MNRCAVIATHHKTGTVWMRSVFRGIAKALDIRFKDTKRSAALPRDSLIVPSIVFDNHSEFRNCRWLLSHPDTRIFHLIRDPRDVVISGMHHHRKASEPWLHSPRSTFDGLTYQQKINSFPNDQLRYLFEMRNSAQRSVGAMRKWDYGRTNSFECRYEDLISDVDMIKFADILAHLGFEDGELEACRNIIRSNSLFGDVRQEKQGHIRSGGVTQWKTVFNAELGLAFVELFGDVLVQLGYEKDDSWVELLPPYSGESARSDEELGCAGQPSA